MRRTAICPVPGCGEGTLPASAFCFAHAVRELRLAERHARIRARIARTKSALIAAATALNGAPPGPRSAGIRIARGA